MSTLVHHENGAFRKQSSKRKNLAFPFCGGGKFLKMEHLENDGIQIIM